MDVHLNTFPRRQGPTKGCRHPHIIAQGHDDDLQGGFKRTIKRKCNFLFPW